MAVLQKIRSKGVLLVSAIALALFLFVAGDLFRGLESIFRSSDQQVGEVAGKPVSIQEYQKMIEDWQTYAEITRNQSSFSEDELNQIKEQAWQSYVQSQIIKEQCDKLGIAVSDNEVSDVVKSGNSQWLQIPLFFNQQTNSYDFSVVSTFLSEYKKMKDAGTQMPEVYEKLYNYYLFAQRQIRDQLLTQKYQVLMSQCFLSNPVEAKLAFDNRATESKVLLATLPASSVKDDAVTVSDDEIKAKYNEDKEKFKQDIETRDIKIIDIQVIASDADKKAAEADLAEAASKLNAATTNTAAGNVVRQASSIIPYSDVYKKKEAFPTIIASALDSAAVGTVAKPAYDGMSNTYYTYKVLGKITQSDSVLYRQIAVIGKDDADIAKKADSIVTALNGGASFADIAKKYNQTSDSTWFTTSSYQQLALDADNALFVNTVIGLNAGEIKKLKLDNGATFVFQALKTANPITKYNVAVVQKELKFSDDTYSKEYNKFSSFIASNPTLEQMEANAPKSGYVVRPINDVIAASHGIAGIRATRDALKWVFDDAKVGDVSQLYECGSNDHLLIVALTGINKEGYASVDKVKDYITAQLKNDKKIEKLYESAKNVKSIDDARKLKDVVVDTLPPMSFATATYVPSTGASEPIISAVASKTAKNAFAGPIKGNNGVYMLKVLDKTKTAEKYDAKAEQESLSRSNFMAAINATLYVLQTKANVKDNRYKFF